MYLRSKSKFNKYFNFDSLKTNFLRNKSITYLKNDICIGKSISENKYWEIWMLKYIQENYIPNTNMIDLGGNIGTTSLLMSEVISDNSKIYSFEPIYDDILFKNVLDNELYNKIIVYNYGVSNKLDFFKIQNINMLGNYNFGAVSINNVLTNEENGLIIKVLPLDSFNFENVSLIKIDVEHMEIEVLEGAIELIKRCKPTILIETYKLNTLKTTEVFKILMELGYDINIIPEGHYDFIMKIKK